MLARRPAARMDRAHQVPEVPEPEPVCRILGDQGGRLQRQPRRTVAVRHPHRLAPGDAMNETGGFSADSSSLVLPATSKTTTFGTTRSTASTSSPVQSRDSPEATVT